MRSVFNDSRLKRGVEGLGGFRDGRSGATTAGGKRVVVWELEHLVRKLQGVLGWRISGLEEPPPHTLAWTPSCLDLSVPRDRAVLPSRSSEPLCQA